MRDHDLDHLLANRNYEPARYGFEQRIIAHARATRQRPANWVRAMLDDLLKPRMQLVYALVLTLGIALGLNTPSNTSTTQYSSYLSDDGATL